MAYVAIIANWGKLASVSYLIDSTDFKAISSILSLPIDYCIVLVLTYSVWEHVMKSRNR